MDRMRGWREGTWCVRMGQKGKGYGLAIQDRARLRECVAGFQRIGALVSFMDWPP
jgi:hypothetical protein